MSFLVCWNSFSSLGMLFESIMYVWEVKKVRSHLNFLSLILYRAHCIHLVSLSQKTSLFHSCIHGWICSGEWLYAILFQSNVEWSLLYVYTIHRSLAGDESGFDWTAWIRGSGRFEKKMVAMVIDRIFIRIYVGYKNRCHLCHWSATSLFYHSKKIQIFSLK